MNPDCEKIEEHRKKTAIDLIKKVCNSRNSDYLWEIIWKHGFRLDVKYPLVTSLTQGPLVASMPNTVVPTQRNKTCDGITTLQTVSRGTITDEPFKVSCLKTNVESIINSFDMMSSDSSSVHNYKSAPYPEHAINLLDETTCYYDTAESIRTLDSGYNSESLLVRSCVHFEPFRISDLLNTIFQYLVYSAVNNVNTNVICLIKNKKCVKVEEGVDLFMGELISNYQNERHNGSNIFEIIKQLSSGNHHYTLTSVTILTRHIAEYIDVICHEEYLNYDKFRHLFYLMSNIDDILKKFLCYLNESNSSINSTVKETMIKSLRDIKKTFTLRKMLLRNKTYLTQVSVFVNDILCSIMSVLVVLRSDKPCIKM